MKLPIKRDKTKAQIELDKALEKMGKKPGEKTKKKGKK